MSVQSKSQIQALEKSVAPKLARRVMFSLLQRLSHGGLTLSEGGRVYSFGDMQSGLQADIEIKDDGFYRRALLGGTIGIGESYRDGQWESASPVGLVRLMLRNYTLISRLDDVIGAPINIWRRCLNVFRRNSVAGSKKNIQAHYDIGNDFYRLFLDESMAYSCAVFDKGDDLYKAQLRKFDLICQRLDLKPGEHLLEIGTGWGGLAIYAATYYGAKVTTTTISEEQYKYTAQRLKDTRLQDQVTLLREDYRNLQGQFDKLVSVEMIEAVGHQYLPTYIKQCERLLRPGGTLLLQSITIADQRYDSYRRQVDFIQTYIFPGGFLPSVNALSTTLRRHTGLQFRHLHDIGPHYATTLAEWSKRLTEKKSQLSSQGLDDAFYRLWQFYFHYCEGGFREGAISTVHLVAEKPRY